MSFNVQGAAKPQNLVEAKISLKPTWDSFEASRALEINPLVSFNDEEHDNRDCRLPQALQS